MYKSSFTTTQTTGTRLLGQPANVYASAGVAV